MMKKILTTALLCLGLSIPVLATAVVDDPALEKALNKEIKKELEMCLDWIRDKKQVGHRLYVNYTAIGSYDKEYGCGGQFPAISGLAEVQHNLETDEYTIVDLDVLANVAIEYTYIDSMSISNDGILTLHTVSKADNYSHFPPLDKYTAKIRLWDMKLLSNQFTGRIIDERGEETEEEY